MILFDEIEKAHHDVLTVMLQNLDDGRTVDFKNTIITMTSNIGSPHLAENATQSCEIAEGVRRQVFAELRAHFRPKFLNRMDEIVLFKSLTLSEIEKIVDLQLKLATRLAERHTELELTSFAKQHVTREGCDPVYGARPLKRFLQRHLETVLSRIRLAGEVHDNTRVTVDYKDDAPVFGSAPLQKREEKEAA